MRYFVLVLIVVFGCGSKDPDFRLETHRTTDIPPTDYISPPAGAVDGGNDPRPDVSVPDAAIALAEDSGKSDAIVVTDAAIDSGVESDASSDFLYSCTSTCSPGLECVSGDKTTPVPTPNYHWCTHGCGSDGECRPGRCSASGVCYLPMGN